jgi:RHS repeat-associated protein
LECQPELDPFEAPNALERAASIWGGSAVFNGGFGPEPADNYEYAAGGTLLAGSNSTAMLFQGEAFETALGDYYLRARWINSFKNVFQTMDGFGGYIESPASLNKYQYVRSDGGINRRDPSGNFDLSYPFGEPICE